ncbi:MAG TPA: shikimate dehydrogenase [Bacteroidales bacterium]|nr:shikimate dehydrogenase [Bacteroidales bacterium]HPS17752.1 shikimate dehydrogenase [Bacteroidales bacterium]
MNLYGLIGYPLTHSFSAQYFSEKFFRENIHDCRYELFPIKDISEIEFLVKNNIDLKGLNVTIPYKEIIIPFLASIDNTAKEIGAVNTIKIIDNKNFILHGYNTDAFGFEESFKPILKKNHTKALILGNGGASKAVAYVLKKLGIEFLFVTRNKKIINESIFYSDLNKEFIKSHLIIINTTPLGMYPETHTAPDIPYHFISNEHILYDLVYNPSETIFMKRGIEQKAIVKNGLEMLYLQAEKAWTIWNG